MFESVLVVNVQSLDVHVHFADRNADRLFDRELDAIHDAVRNFGNARAVLNHDVQVDHNFPVDDSDVNAATIISAREDFGNAIADVLVCHSDDAVALEYGLTGKACDGGWRNLDASQKSFFTHSFFLLGTAASARPRLNLRKTIDCGIIVLH